MRWFEGAQSGVEERRVTVEKIAVDSLALSEEPPLVEILRFVVTGSSGELSRSGDGLTTAIATSASAASAPPISGCPHFSEAEHAPSIATAGPAAVARPRAGQSSDHWCAAVLHTGLLAIQCDIGEVRAQGSRQVRAGAERPLLDPHVSRHRRRSCSCRWLCETGVYWRFSPSR